MTRQTNPDATDSTGIDSLTDPGRLTDRDDVDHCTDTFPHESEDHCEADYEGRAIVGVVDDAGDLLACVPDERDSLVLPNAKIEAGDDWVAEGEREVADLTGLDVKIQVVERVRRAEHVVEGKEAPFETTTHAVFRAAPTGDAMEITQPDEGDGWSVEWLDALPARLEAVDNPAVDDVRLFVE